MAVVDVAAVAAFERLARFVEGVEGQGLSCAVRQRDEGEREWLVALEWGKEAEDSPMIGAAAYGTGDTAAAAIHQALDDTRTPRERPPREPSARGIVRAVVDRLQAEFVADEFRASAEAVFQQVEYEVQDYLDEAIRNWRQRLAEAKEPGPDHRDPEAHRQARRDQRRNVLMAECYIDAFQSVRSSLLGDTLPADDGEQGVTATLERAGDGDGEGLPLMGAGTDELVGHFEQHTKFPGGVLDAAIPAAIDAVYTARDAGKDMHRAGAEAAVAVLEAAWFLVAPAHEGLSAEEWCGRARRAEKALLERGLDVRRLQEEIDHADEAFDMALAGLGVVLLPVVGLAARWAWRRRRP